MSDALIPSTASRLRIGDLLLVGREYQPKLVRITGIKEVLAEGNRFLSVMLEDGDEQILAPAQPVIFSGYWT